MRPLLTRTFSGRLKNLAIQNIYLLPADFAYTYSVRQKLIIRQKPTKNKLI